MRRSPRRRALRGATVALGLVAALSAIAPPASVDAAADLLPDLRAGKITDLRIQKTGGGKRLLRFTGVMWNSGRGPLETRAKRANRKAAWDVDQIIYDKHGPKRRIETNASMKYAGDGHDHWHVRRMLTYHLWGPGGTVRDSKVGFCFFDTNLIKGSLPRSPSRITYRQSSCGHRNSLKTKNGISVGWGDRYPWNFAYQWIDVTGLPAGTYTLRSVVDLYGYFTEGSDTNNCAWAKIRIKASGSKVKVLDRGKSCVNDFKGTRYADDVAWARAAGIRPCDADLFCPGNTMTRGEVADFLDRVIDPAAATTDHFTDDDDNKYEGAIDRLAEAGIVTGCTATTYCPESRARRSAFAVFLDRALAPPDTADDFFDDDDGTAAEAAINRLAAIGVAVGCGTRTFCPTTTITRGGAMEMLRLAYETPTP